MKQEIIDEIFDIIDYNIKETQPSLEHIQELLPLESFSKTKKEIESLGLSIEDFQYTGFNVMPFRYIKGVTILDVMDMSKSYLEFLEVEQRVKSQREMCEAYLKEDDFDGFIEFLDKRLKLDAFKVLFEFIPIEDRYTIFRKIYTRMEYGFRNDRDFLEHCFEARHHSEEWKQAIESLNEIVQGKKLITVYRGEGEKSTPYQDAFSWSIKKKVATFFADRFNDRGKIYKAQISVDDVVDYLEHRNEFEIILRAEDLKNITRVR